MPAGSKVHRVYKALRRQGYSKGAAARMAQHKTGQALKTGRRPRRSKVSRR